MQEAIRKAAALIEAMPYIRAFQGRIFVIKFGGAAMEDPSTLDCVLDDVVFLQTVGILPVLIHGGGPAISRAMKARNLEPKFVRGHRVTDPETLEIVRDVLVNQINAGICARLIQMHGQPASFANPSTGALRAKRRLLRESQPDGTTVELDIGLVGDIESIDEAAFHKAMEEKKVPVVASLARGHDGETLNVNADVVAAFVAGALRAEKVVFLSNTHGILTNPSDPASFADTLSEAHIHELIRQGVISGGMLPKVDACLAALGHGVHKAHIVDGRLKHSLLLEIFTDQGAGTQIVHG